MIITITVEVNDYTGDITASMSPIVGLLQVHQGRVVIWEHQQTSNSKYDKAVRNQKSKPKLRMV